MTGSQDQILEVRRPRPDVAVLALDRPDVLNALSFELVDRLHDALDELHTDNTCRVVVLTGAGRAFCAGLDLADTGRPSTAHGTSGPRAGMLSQERIAELPIKLRKLQQPVIAAVNGFALGGGCELALACHIRYGATNAKFGQPEVNLGIIPGYGGTQRLTRLVGVVKATELILTGNVIGSQDALAMGLINSMYEPEELLAAAEKTAAIIAAKAPIAVRAALAAILAAGQTATNEGMETEARKFGVVCGTSDFAEGTSAFLEKRPAHFTGQ